MNRLELSEEHLTGISEIDSRYRKLFARINTVLFPEPASVTAENISSTLIYLIHYMEEQFSDEERMMDYYCYNKLDSHRKQHKELQRKVDLLYHQTQKKTESSRVLADKLYCLLNDWFTCHILEWDHHYTLFVQKQACLEFKTISHTGLDFSKAEVIDFEECKYSVEPKVAGTDN